VARNAVMAMDSLEWPPDGAGSNGRLMARARFWRKGLAGG